MNYCSNFYHILTDLNTAFMPISAIFSAHFRLLIKSSTFSQHESNIHRMNTFFYIMLYDKLLPIFDTKVTLYPLSHCTALIFMKAYFEEYFDRTLITVIYFYGHFSYQGGVSKRSDSAKKCLKYQYLSCRTNRAKNMEKIGLNDNRGKISIKEKNVLC